MADKKKPEAIYAVKLICGGRAGQVGGRLLMEALREQGIPVAEPWVIDHDDSVKSRFYRQEGWRPWHVHPREFGAELIRRKYRELGFDTRFLPREKDKLPEAADNPPVFRTMLDLRDALMSGEFCRDLVRIAEDHEYLVLLFLYCPDGPTSGTVAVDLAMRSRKWWSEAKQTWELSQRAKDLSIVWMGLELCPCDPEADGGTENSWICGHVRRLELNGLMEGEDKPFDFVIVSDPAPLTGYQRDLVSNMDLNRFTGEAIAKLLGRWFRDDLKELFERDQGLSLHRHPRWDMGFLKIGFSREEMDILARLQEATGLDSPREARRYFARHRATLALSRTEAQQVNGAIKKWATAGSRLWFGRAARISEARDAYVRVVSTALQSRCNPTAYRFLPRSVREIVRICRERGCQLLPAMEESGLDNEIDTLRNDATDYFSNRQFGRLPPFRRREGEGFSHVYLLGAAFEQNWETLFPNFEAPAAAPKQKLALVMRGGGHPEVYVHRSASFEEPFLAEIFGLAGPSRLEDLGNFGRYKTKFEAVGEGLKDRYKAFPEAWLSVEDVLKKLG